MLDSAGYWIAWGVYWTAMLVVWLLWWRLTRHGKGLLWSLLRWLPVTWMLAPVASPVHEGWWMPALIVATLGTIADGPEMGRHGAVALIVATAVGLVVGLLTWWLQRRATPAQRRPSITPVEP